MSRHSNQILGLTRATLSLLFLLNITEGTYGQDPAILLEDTVIRIVEKYEAAVVSIARVTLNPAEKIPRDPEPLGLRERIPEVLPNEFGTGCLVSRSNDLERFVLTNYHVVRGGPVDPNFGGENETTTLTVHFSDRRQCQAAIIAADPRSDLAVLRLNWQEARVFPRFDWEAAAAPRKGQFVVLMGNPYHIARDGSASVSWGLISNLTRQTLNPFSNQEELSKRSMLYRLGAVMQLDARLNLGQSGSPVLNLKGELIGIGTSLAAIEGHEQSAGFAIPIDPLTRRIIRSLLAGQEVEYGMLGIFPAEARGPEFAQLKSRLALSSAAMIHDISAGSPAAIAGLNVGDYILEVEGEPVRGVDDLMRLVGLHGPGETISVKAWVRGRQLATVTVKLGKWPVSDDEGIIETKPRYLSWRGMSVDYSTARERFRPHRSMDQRCVLVTKVLPDSPADAARIVPGYFVTHVNEKPVRTPEEFHSAIKNLTGTVALRLADLQSEELQQGPNRGRTIRISDPQTP